MVGKAAAGGGGGWLAFTAGDGRGAAPRTSISCSGFSSMVAGSESKSEPALGRAGGAVRSVDSELAVSAPTISDCSDSSESASELDGVSFCSGFVATSR